MSIRIGGLLVPVIAIVAGCSAGVGDGAVGASQEEVQGTQVHPGDVDGEACAVTGVGGRATGLGVRVGLEVLDLGVGATVVISDTGELSTIGASKSAELLGADVANVVHTGVLASKTSSTFDSTTSSASVAGIAVRVAGLSITANILASHAAATCGNFGASTSGGADIAALAIDGKAIVVTGAPNQLINLGVATIVINEVNRASTGGGANIEVEALHIRALGIADVVISAATASVTCTCDGPTAPPPVKAPPSCGTSSDCCAKELCYNDLCTPD